MKDELILKADKLYFSYEDGEDSHSLNGLSLEIKRGQKIAFMGSNGSGKSTFFLCCNGIHKPSSGTLYFDGKPVDYSRKGLLDLRSKVGIVFQDPDNQLFSASVYQEISFGILNLGFSAEEAAKEVERVIDELEITPFRTKPTHALSGGQKKQVSIADILIMRPEIIILDEPASALDPKHSQMVNKIIDRLTDEGITVLIATHDVDYAYEWADEVFIFHEGQVLLHGSPEAVFENKDVIAKANLKAPAVLELFDTLVDKEILAANLPVPKNLRQLEGYISQSAVQKKTRNGENRMKENNTKKAILVVSFGTSHADTREKTITAIEKEIERSFPDYALYYAWTSKMIIEKLKKRDSLSIPTVKEALLKMKEDGITEVIVQPTHIINGIENEGMKQDALSCREYFSSLRFGAPLLTSQQDNDRVIQILSEEFKDLRRDQALVLMGHGTSHYSNSVYAAMDYSFKEQGFSNIYVGTVEAYPSLQSIKKMLKESEVKEILLTPLMIVAGDHAKNDMAGDDPESWSSQLKDEGYLVTPIVKGLGEYPAIRKIFADHIREAK